MRICVIDGQGGGIGAALIKRLKEVYREEHEVIALGTNAVATAQMMKARANRGASGIDGTIATACGFSRGSARPVTLLTGDVAALHDLNSLALLRSLEKPMTIVLINNDDSLELLLRNLDA